MATEKEWTASNARAPLMRRARATDAAAISALYCQLVSNPAVDVQPERLAQLAAMPDQAVFVAECAGRVVATALVCLCADVMFGARPFAVVENVVVDESMRGHGVGEALFRHLEAFCLQADCSKVMLLSAVARFDAHRFFERIGYVGDAKRGFVKYRRQLEAGPGPA